MPLLSGLSTGVKHGTRLRATAISMVLWAAKIEPLSESHCTGCGARIAPKRCSTQWTIMSRIISPEMPAVGGDPADDLAVVAIEGEGQAHGLAVPAGELETVRAPADIGAQCCHLAVVLARAAPAGVPGQQQAMPPHQPIDPLGVDRGQTVGSPLALEERGDPPVPVGWSRVDEAADVGGQLKVAITVLRSAFRPHTLDALGDVRAGEAERLGDRLHREPSGSTELDSKIAFFARAKSSASLRISFSMVLRPKSRSRSRTRSSSRRNSAAGTTSS